MSDPDGDIIPKSEAKGINKKRKITIALILLGYFIVFLLTFIFTGGLEALLQFATETSQAIEDIIRELITGLGEVLP